ncbi:hypothetical protein RchiOBHm_Chr5g0080271 [Rosa chinensis]|uniref:Uncharacterized protein n=1 Tax=Rosa chinensis TaxID=74649 RepID=A0A2P6QMP8_ROSCH|nr:hypothetical protein RchiOBHm_Chr5g0080271 [Rosa chinensis]
MNRQTLAPASLQGERASDFRSNYTATKFNAPTRQDHQNPGGKLVYQTTKKGKRTQVSCYWQEYSRDL